MPAVASPPVDPVAMRRAADDACRLMRVLANPDRLLLLCQLAQGDCRVGDLERACGIGQPTLSQQLGVLREEGLVDAAREGRHVRYRILSPQALALMRVLQEQFCPPSDPEQP
jgi:DNA-binding transcriptional ArsR family regulator